MRERHEVVPLALNYPHISREWIFADSFNFAKNISFRNQGSKKFLNAWLIRGIVLLDVWYRDLWLEKQEYLVTLSFKLFL